jgi:hypothetical protein
MEYGIRTRSLLVYTRYGTSTREFNSLGRVLIQSVTGMLARACHGIEDSFEKHGTTATDIIRIAVYNDGKGP